MTRAIGLHICFFEMEIPKIVLRIGRFVVKKKKLFQQLQYKFNYKNKEQ